MAFPHLNNTVYETAPTLNFIFHETASMNNNNNPNLDSYREQMRTANQEYRELRLELRELQGRRDRNEKRLLQTRRGAAEAFECERAGLEIEKARLEGKEKQVEELIRRWLAILEECLRGMVSTTSTTSTTTTTTTTAAAATDPRTSCCAGHHHFMVGAPPATPPTALQIAAPPTAPLTAPPTATPPTTAPPTATPPTAAPPTATPPTAPLAPPRGLFSSYSGAPPPVIPKRASLSSFSFTKIPS